MLQFSEPPRNHLGARLCYNSTMARVKGKGLDTQGNNPQTRLSAKQKRFLEHYFVNWSAVKSAKLAGYTSKDMGSSGSAIMSNARIASAIQVRLESLGVSANETLWRVGQIARGSMPYFLVDGKIDLHSDTAKENYHLIKKVRSTTITRYSKEEDPIVTETIEIETYDALAALTLLAKHHRLLDADTGAQVQNNNTLIINSPAQASAMGVDPLAVAQELDRIMNQWRATNESNDSAPDVPLLIDGVVESQE